MSHNTDIDLLMIGKTGSGKSALGNAILKRKRFLSMSSTDSVTTEINYEVAEYKGKILKVVDGPGVGDTRLETRESVDLVAGKMEQAMLINPRGYHAFLLVVKFGSRFTAEDQDTVAFLKNLFGPDFVKKYCILVMTCGDLFERDSEDTGQKFEQWCNCQKGVFRDLLQECCNRIVLFDNTTKDEVKQNAQIDCLLDTISHLQAHGHRYTDQSFGQAAKLRQIALVKSKKPVITEEILQEVSLILQKLNEEKIEFHYDSPITPLQELSARCAKLINSVKEQDKGTGALQDLEEKVKSLKQSVEDAILVHTTAKDERRKLEQKEETMIQQMEKEMQERRQHMKRIQEEMNENVEKQRRYYEEMLNKNILDREQMQQEFDRKRMEIEDENRMRLQAAQEDFDEQQRISDENLALERRAQDERINYILADAMQQMHTEAQNLDATYRESKTCAAQVMKNVLGYSALVVGHIIAPEIMGVLWLGSSMYAAYQNK